MSDQVWIEGAEFAMGSDSHYPDERPSRLVEVEGFWIDVHPVTNRQFAAFVDATNYRTIAEVAPSADDYPDAAPENLVPGSGVFAKTPGPVDLRLPYQWWAWVPGADWRHPTGPESSLVGLDDHPVVHVAYDDALAYLEWADADLPTEAEWELAARGGLEGCEFAWGEHDPQDTSDALANTWQGQFPCENTALDGWEATSPVGSYPANGFGLVDMIGNVWEWTADYYSEGGSDSQSPCCGPSREAASFDPAFAELEIARRVIKGGSFLCNRSYCFRYRPAARQPQAIDSATNHIGFRSVRRTAPSP